MSTLKVYGDITVPSSGMKLKGYQACFSFDQVAGTFHSQTNISSATDYQVSATVMSMANCMYSASYSMVGNVASIQADLGKTCAVRAINNEVEPWFKSVDKCHIIFSTRGVIRDIQCIEGAFIGT